MYADDIVILADNPQKLQAMIRNLEKYCNAWNLTVNISKSKIMVFRRGGRLGRNEKWSFNGSTVEVVSEYEYLGVKFTPQMSFSKCIAERSLKAKKSAFGAWKDLMFNDTISFNVKNSTIKAVARSVQVYSAQVFGYSYSDQINKLQCSLLKSILRLPDCTPSYAIYLETKEYPSSWYALKLHMDYVFKTLFTYNTDRLPHLLSKKIIQYKIFWFKEWLEMEAVLNIRWADLPLDSQRWQYCIKAALENYKVKFYQKCLDRKRTSSQRFYKNLDHQVSYIHQIQRAKDIMIIARARCDVLGLNANSFDSNMNKRCTLCNSQEIEDIRHFLGSCEFLNILRIQAFGKNKLTHEEVVEVLNGISYPWGSVIRFVKEALSLRRNILEIGR